MELKSKEYKLTPQRMTILKVFMENAVGHVSAEELYSMVKKENPDVGLATVYRTLDLLAELGILMKMDFGDGKARFELSDREVHHHHHLICLNCGKVQEFDIDLLEALEESINSKTGFEVVDHRLKFYGYCGDCKR
jgi:Fur family ferric uptake transcriptional regulator